MQRRIFGLAGADMFSRIMYFAVPAIRAASLAACTLACFASSTVHAEEAIAPQTERRCELHVFSTFAVTVSDLTQNTMGGLIPNLLNEAFRVKVLKKSSLSSIRPCRKADQLGLLRSVDHLATLRGKNAVLVIHESPH